MNSSMAARCFSRVRRARGRKSVSYLRSPMECGATLAVPAHTHVARAQPPTEWSAELGEEPGDVVGDGYVRRGDTADIVGIAVDNQDQV